MNNIINKKLSQQLIRKKFPIQKKLNLEIGSITQYFQTIDKFNLQNFEDQNLFNDSKSRELLEENPEALIFFLPSLTDQSQNYGYFFEKFGERLGYTSFALDQLGNGIIQDGNQKYKLAKEKEILDNYWKFIESINEEYKQNLGFELPKFVIGHSVGSLYALRLCQQRPNYFKGSVVINPLFQLKNQLSSFQKAKYFLKQKIQKDPIILEEFEILPQQIYDYNNIQIPNKLSINTYLQIESLQLETADKVKKLATPLLMLLGEFDDVADNEKSRSIFNEMKGVKHKKQFVIGESGSANHFMMSWKDTFESVQKESMGFIQRLVNDVNIKKK